MVDRPKIDEMLSNLHSYAAVLKHLAATSREQFLANTDKTGNAKYHMVIAIECCIDITNHIIASEQYRIPSDNADGFTILYGNYSGHPTAPAAAQAVRPYLRSLLDW